MCDGDEAALPALLGSAVCCVGLSGSGRVVWATEAAASLIGTPMSVGGHFEELLEGDDRPAFRAALEGAGNAGVRPALASVPVCGLEMRVRLGARPERCYVLLVAEPHVEGGRVLAFLVRLGEVKRGKAGSMADAARHSLNNILMVLLGRLELMRMCGELDGEREEALIGLVRMLECLGERRE